MTRLEQNQAALHAFALRVLGRARSGHADHLEGRIPFFAVVTYESPKEQWSLPLNGWVLFAARYDALCFGDPPLLYFSAEQVLMSYQNGGLYLLSLAERPYHFEAIVEPL